MTAIFGALFGLATVTSIVALLIQVVPPRTDRLSAPTAAPSTSAALPPPAHVPVPPKRKERVAVPGPWRVSELSKDASVTLLSGAMDRKSFVEALAEKDIPKAQAYRMMKAFDGLRKFDKTGRKDHFLVALDRSSKRVRAFEYEVTPSEIYQAKEDERGLLVGSRLDLKIASEETEAALYVGKDLTASYKWVGLEDGVVAALDEALSGRVSSESYEEGSTLRLIAEEETALGLFSHYKRLLAVEYRPADPAGKATRVYAFKGQQAKGYFDERGHGFGGGWRTPCPGCPMTSPFNPKRLHPILKKVMPHNGTDFGAPTGTPLYATFKGEVSWVGPHGPTGNYVELLHPNGVSTGYAHLSRFAPGLKRGDKVGTRQLIGYVGSTGRSTGPHLHFVAKKAGKFFNPMTLDLDGEYVMPAGDRPAFLELKAALDKRLDALVLPEPPPEPVAAAPTTSALPSGMPLDPAAAASPSAVQATAPPVAGAAMPAAPQPDPGDDESAGEIPLAPPPPPPPKNKH